MMFIFNNYQKSKAYVLHRYPDAVVDSEGFYKIRSKTYPHTNNVIAEHMFDEEQAWILARKQIIYLEKLRAKELK